MNPCLLSTVVITTVIAILAHQQVVHSCYAPARRAFLFAPFLLSSAAPATAAMSTVQVSTGTCTDASSSSSSCPDPGIQKVVVIGANGQVGFKVVKLLHESSESSIYRPIAMIREAAQASRFEELGVPYFVGDLDSSSSPTVEDLEGAHTVIFAAGAGR